MAVTYQNNKKSKVSKISNAWSTMTNPLRNLTQTGI